MVFLWSLCDSKSPLVSRNFLSILAKLNYAAVLMVSICNPIFKPSSPLSNSLGIVQMAPTTNGILVTFIFHFFLILLQNLHTYLSFQFLLFSLRCLPESQSPLFCRFLSSFLFPFFFFFFFFVLVVYHYVRSSGRDYMIHMYLKIQEKFVELILLDRFLVEHIPLVCMIKFTFFTQLPMDYLPHPVVYSANLLPSFIIWLIVSTLSRHRLYLLYCCI